MELFAVTDLSINWVYSPVIWSSNLKINDVCGIFNLFTNLPMWAQ